MKDKKELEDMVERILMELKTSAKKLEESENCKTKFISLPCCFGDKIWYISMIWDMDGKFIGEIDEANIEGFYITEDNIQIEDDVIYDYHIYGEEVFLTKAEAEAKLKELKEV